MGTKEFDVVVTKWDDGEVDWFRADVPSLTLHEALTRFIVHGITTEILGYYPNRTSGQREALCAQHHKAEGID